MGRQRHRQRQRRARLSPHPPPPWAPRQGESKPPEGLGEPGRCRAHLHRAGSEGREGSGAQPHGPAHARSRVEERGPESRRRRPVALGSSVLDRREGMPQPLSMLRDLTRCWNRLTVSSF